MPRLARIVLPGHPHHVACRGRGQVFASDADRRLYLALLATESRRLGLSVLAYCLMPDAVHLVVVPCTEAALAKAIGRANALYARQANRDGRRHRIAWTPRFQSCPLERDFLPAAVCHVETEPVRARIVRCPWRYPWSSAAAHAGQGDPTGILDLKAMKWWLGKRWREWLREGNSPGQTARILRHTSRGWPIAARDKLADLERWRERRLRPLSPGRPRKPPPSPRDERVPFW